MDVAVAWLLIASGEIPLGKIKAAVMGRGRKLFLDAFLNGTDVAQARVHLESALQWKSTDPHMSDAERRRMRAVVEGAKR